MPKVISRNAIRCLKCKDVIQSTHSHDFKRCSCGACGVDGGHEYLRHLGNPSDYENLSQEVQT